MNQKRNYKAKGFTLVELAVVLAIIGVLSALLVPSMISNIQKAKVTAAIVDAKTIKNAVENSLMQNLGLNDDPSGAYNKVFYLDQNSDVSKRDYEVVGAFTNRSWYDYRTKKNLTGKSAKVDKIIAAALDNAVSEEWKTGTQTNPMSYNSDKNNCAKYLKDCNTNFGLVVVYDSDFEVRLMQIYRKGILVTYVNGEYIPNANKNAHFVGPNVLSTIYTDAGMTAGEGLYKLSLAKGQLGDDGKLGGWY